jgi:hypothetical protein
VVKPTIPESTRASVLNQIEALRNEFNDRQATSPPPITSLQCAYEIRMQRLYDILDSATEGVRAAE